MNLKILRGVFLSSAFALMAAPQAYAIPDDYKMLTRQTLQMTGVRADSNLLWQISGEFSNELLPMMDVKQARKKLRSGLGGTQHVFPGIKWDQDRGVAYFFVHKNEFQIKADIRMGSKPSFDVEVESRRYVVYLQLASPVSVRRNGWICRTEEAIEVAKDGSFTLKKNNCPELSVTAAHVEPAHFSGGQNSLNLKAMGRISKPKLLLKVPAMVKLANNPSLKNLTRLVTKILKGAKMNGGERSRALNYVEEASEALIELEYL